MKSRFVLMTSMVIGGLAHSPPCRAEAPELGNVVSTLGRVTVQHVKATEPVPLRSPDAVFAGDVVATGPRSGVKLLMADKSIVDVGAGSQLFIGRVRVGLKEARVKLALGQGLFRARLPASTTGTGSRLQSGATSVDAGRGGAEIVGTVTRDEKRITERFVVLEGEAVVTSGPSSRPLHVTKGRQVVVAPAADDGSHVSRAARATLSQVAVPRTAELDRLSDEELIGDMLAQIDITGDGALFPMPILPPPSPPDTSVPQPPPPTFPGIPRDVTIRLKP